MQRTDPRWPTAARCGPLRPTAAPIRAVSGMDSWRRAGPGRAGPGEVVLGQVAGVGEEQPDRVLLAGAPVTAAGGLATAGRLVLGDQPRRRLRLGAAWARTIWCRWCPG